MALLIVVAFILDNALIIFPIVFAVLILRKISSDRAKKERHEKFMNHARSAKSLSTETTIIPEHEQADNLTPEIPTSTDHW